MQQHLSTHRDVRYEYDAGGRTVLCPNKRMPHKPDTWRYKRGALDRLVSCITPNGSRWAYTCDSRGHRTTKQCLGDYGENPVEVVYFTWEDTRLAREHSKAPRCVGVHGC